MLKGGAAVGGGRGDHRRAPREARLLGKEQGKYRFIRSSFTRSPDNSFIVTYMLSKSLSASSSTRLIVQFVVGKTVEQLSGLPCHQKLTPSRRAYLVGLFRGSSATV